MLALQFEVVVGGRDLEAFVAEDVDDMNLLMKVLRDDLKLSKISVVHSRSGPKKFAACLLFKLARTSLCCRWPHLSMMFDFNFGSPKTKIFSNYKASELRK